MQQIVHIDDQSLARAAAQLLLMVRIHETAQRLRVDEDRVARIQRLCRRQMKLLCRGASRRLAQSGVEAGEQEITVWCGEVEMIFGRNPQGRLTVSRMMVNAAV